MLPHSGPVVAFLALLALAGVQKLIDPNPTAGALRASGLPGSRGIVTLLGAGEVVIGVTGILIGGRIPAMLAVGLYAGFAVFVLNALMKRLPIRSCGCLGAADAPPTSIHLLVNLIAIGFLTAAVFVPVDMIAGFSEFGPAGVAAFILMTGASVFLLYGALAVLPLSLASRRETPVTLSHKGSVST
ncbi:MAG TPA: MauE/DoxX family redox-associated membrane protein [Acidimicrobiia bacterium]